MSLEENEAKEIRADVLEDVENTEKQEEDNRFLNLEYSKDIDISKIEEKSFEDLRNTELTFKDANSIFGNAINELDDVGTEGNIKSTIKYIYSRRNGVRASTIYMANSEVSIDSFINDFCNFFSKELKGNINLRETISSRVNSKRTQEMIIIIGSEHSEIYLYYDIDILFIHYNGSQLKEDSILSCLMGVIKSYVKPEVRKNSIFVVYQTPHGFEKIAFNVNKKKSGTIIEDNYNDDFKEINNRIIKKLNNKDKTGLFIFNGEPGTGKTQYVRYLSSVIDRNIIFVPPDMVNIITDPSFIPFLLNNPDCVLVIEDAESALQERNNGGRTGNISNVLNMTDGLLSDCVNISIVVTFNTDFKNLDKALLRKGRLLESYEFGKLSTNKAQKLMNKLGHNVKVNKPMTLADIYFYEDYNNNSNYGNKKVSGFRKE